MLKWSAFSTVGRHSSHSVQGTRLCVRHRWASSICRSYAVPHGLFDLSLCTAQNCQEQLHNFFSPLRIVIAGAVLDCLRAARAVLERETRATNGNTRGKECQTRFVASIEETQQQTVNKMPLTLTPVHSHRQKSAEDAK